MRCILAKVFTAFLQVLDNWMCYNWMYYNWMCYSTFL